MSQQPSLNVSLSAEQDRPLIIRRLKRAWIIFWVETILLAAAFVFLFYSVAAAQQIFRDNSGNVTGRSTTGTDGTTTYYDAHGNRLMHAVPGTNNTTTIYDSRGRNVGTSQTNRPGRKR